MANLLWWPDEWEEMDAEDRLEWFLENSIFDGLQFVDQRPHVQLADPKNLLHTNVLMPPGFTRKEPWKLWNLKASDLWDGRFVYSAFAREREFLIVDILHRESL